MSIAKRTCVEKILMRVCLHRIIREEMTMPQTDDEKEIYCALERGEITIGKEMPCFWHFREGGMGAWSQAFISMINRSSRLSRPEALANARLFKVSERMLAHLKWFAENDGECLGDHPLMLAKIQAIITEVENV